MILTKRLVQALVVTSYLSLNLDLAQPADKTLAIDCEVARDCTSTEDRQVCASDGVTYRNECEFELAYCLEPNDQFYIVSSGVCRGIPDTREAPPLSELAGTEPLQPSAQQQDVVFNDPGIIVNELLSNSDKGDAGVEEEAWIAVPQDIVFEDKGIIINESETEDPIAAPQDVVFQDPGIVINQDIVATPQDVVFQDPGIIINEDVVGNELSEQGDDDGDDPVFSSPEDVDESVAVRQDVVFQDPGIVVNEDVHINQVTLTSNEVFQDPGYVINEGVTRDTVFQDPGIVINERNQGYDTGYTTSDYVFNDPGIVINERPGENGFQTLEGPTVNPYCGLQCTGYDVVPVCGTDGVSYINDCHLLTTKCLKPDVEKAYDGLCVHGVKGNVGFGIVSGQAVVRSAETMEVTPLVLQRNRCNPICPRGVYQPVCGSNGITYASTCLLDYASCQNTRIVELHDGKCMDQYRSPGEKGGEDIGDANNCIPTPCPSTEAPVCGSDGQTYMNICFLSNAQCQNLHLTMLYDGECGYDTTLTCAKLTCPQYTECREEQSSEVAYCADVCSPERCGEYEVCQLQESECFTAPCSPIATCVAIEDQ